MISKNVAVYVTIIGSNQGSTYAGMPTWTSEAQSVSRRRGSTWVAWKAMPRKAFPLRPKGPLPGGTGSGARTGSMRDAVTDRDEGTAGSDVADRSLAAGIPGRETTRGEPL